MLSRHAMNDDAEIEPREIPSDQQGSWMEIRDTPPDEQRF
jgi:hypothetical protein